MIKSSNYMTHPHQDRIYLFTNELFSAYEKYFENKPKVLSVIGSGDQIFNAILKGSNQIEAFDINVLAKYYFYFKKAAIEVLSKDEFINMFLEPEMSSIYYRYIERIMNNLDDSTKSFWDYLIQKCNKNWYLLYFSPLFHSNAFYVEDIIYTNPYLHSSEYLKLKGLLKDAQIEVKDGDILKLADEYHQKNFDLIYLSNIWSYVSWNEYSKMQKKLNLTDNGYLIAYSFREKNYPFPDINSEKKKISRDESLIVYTKKK